MKSPLKHSNGFTLFETLIASLLLAMIVMVITQSKSSSLYNSAESENIATAVQLLQKKTSEMEFYFQKKVNSDSVANAKEKLEGSFDAPFENFKWRAEMRETLLEIKKDDIVGLMKEAGVDANDAEVQVEQQAIALTNINKAIKENYGELEVWVEWNRFGRKKTINVLTHLIPATPKISISLEPEVE